MNRLVIVAIFSLLLANSGFSYRFICNGLVASGVQREDSCGTVCDEEHAARWANPNLSVVVGKKTLPEGLSLSDWEQVVKASFAAWENVAGSTLRFVPVEGESKREFKANDQVHELYWITDKEEWREVVGVGELGTLGATLPKYTCGSADSNREIFDADLVLNGMPHVNWQIGCKDEDCIDPQTTLVHELGHWFGLDHPCLLCSTSIMSARAGFDLIEPVFDDMAGIRALYPDHSTGGFGVACSTDAECGKGICVSDDNNKYCSTSCKDDRDCEASALCQVRQNGNACVFIGANNARGKKEGDSCDRRPCSEPLICAGAMKDAFFCFKPCKITDECGFDQACVPIGGNSKVCVAIKQLGQACNARELCTEGLYCLLEGDKGLCRQPCGVVNAHGTGCPPGQICHVFGLKQEVCVPEELNLNADSASFDDGPPSDVLGRHGISAPPKSQMGCNVEPGITNNITWLCLLLLGLGLRLRFQRD